MNTQYTHIFSKLNEALADITIILLQWFRHAENTPPNGFIITFLR